MEADQVQFVDDYVEADAKIQAIWSELETQIEAEIEARIKACQFVVEQLAIGIEENEELWGLKQLDMVETLENYGIDILAPFEVLARLEIQKEDYGIGWMNFEPHEIENTLKRYTDRGSVGFWYAYRDIQKKILKKDYDIDWMTPLEREILACFECCEDDGDNNRKLVIDKETEAKIDLIRAELDIKIEERLSRIGKKEYSIGDCHLVWAITKEILKKDYGIDWKTPHELNPDVFFD